MESTNSNHKSTLILYDQSGQILCTTDKLFSLPPESVIGSPAWKHLAGQDALICQGALIRCEQSGEPQTFDVDVPELGRWRTTIYRCHAGRVRMVGITRPFPASVLSLTDRQLQICGLLAAGLTSREIARQLDIARETVDNHRSLIARRIGINPWSLLAWCGEHREWF